MFLPDTQTDPNAFSYPLSAGTEAASGSDVLAWDRAQVAELLAKARETSAGAGGGLDQHVQRLVKSATNTHALTRKLQFLTDETDAEALGGNCEFFGRNAEAAARIFATKAAGMRTSAVPPHDVLKVAGSASAAVGSSFL